MKILKLTAENFKRLRAVEITPDPTTNLIQVRGRNGQGKSSVLDAIWAAVGGATAQPRKPVRNGEDKATIRLDLGDIVVIRRFRQDGLTDLRLEAADGARYGSPQTMLDKLIGAIAFDPLEFTRQRPRDQLESLRQMVKLDIDIDALDQQNATDYAARTAINRDVAALRVRLEGLPTEPTPAGEPIDVQALTQRLAAASDYNTTLERRRAGRAQAAEQISELRRHADEIETSIPSQTHRIEIAAQATVADLENRIETLRHEIANLETRLATASTNADDAITETRRLLKGDATVLREQADAIQAKLDAADPLPDPIDATALAAEIAEAAKINAILDRARRRAEVAKQLIEAQTESECLTTEMQARIKQKTAALAAATYPIPGLALGDGEVLYNDVPLDQASQAEKIRVGVAIAIAANPKLRVIAVRDGSLLDAESMQLLQNLVTEADYQCWVEVTDDDAKIGVIIEDGSIQPIGDVMHASALSTVTDEALPL